MKSKNYYQGRYPLFDASAITHYPLSKRESKVEIGSFVDPEQIMKDEISTEGLLWYKNGIAGEGPDQQRGLNELARLIVGAARDRKPVIAVCGAHFIKNGLSPLIIDLISRGIITLFSGNMASAIHSFEFALIGSSSESVSSGLPSGTFGMAIETNAYLNAAVCVGSEEGLSIGESLGKMYCEERYRNRIIESAVSLHQSDSSWIKPLSGFPHVNTCVYAAAYDNHIPACVHPSIGTDIVNQYQFFDSACFGNAAGYDFLVFVEEIRRCGRGGVILNVGSAVTGPEVVLKACSMAANVGSPPNGIITADFDLRPFGFQSGENESTAGYYFRDQKSIVTRIPQAYGGTGYYFQGPHALTLTALYHSIIGEWST